MECGYDHARTEYPGTQYVRHPIDTGHDRNGHGYINHRYIDRNQHGHRYHGFQHNRRGRNEQLHHQRFYGSMCYDRDWHGGYGFDDVGDRNNVGHVGRYVNSWNLGDDASDVHHGLHAGVESARCDVDRSRRNEYAEHHDHTEHHNHTEQYRTGIALAVLGLISGIAKRCRLFCGQSTQPRPKNQAR